MNLRQLARARSLLCALQDHIRDTVVAARAEHGARFAQVSAITRADTIYHIDKISEEAITAWFTTHWPRNWPVELVMEGLEGEEALTFPRGTPVSRTDWKCILDPIDGTRGLMYDKRSAWILAGLAPQRRTRNHLGDIVVAAMTEIPTSKQWRADQLSAVRGGGPRSVRASSFDIRTGQRAPLHLAPSQATDFRHGFASFAKFFPDGKTLLASLEEQLWRTLHPPSGSDASPLVFDDQYISTGGQLYELLCGHDRFVADLRPLAFAKLGLSSSLVCHPYDICTELILRESGCLIETPLGRALRAPLDTTSPVSWVGYANPALAALARPVLTQLLSQW